MKWLRRIRGLLGVGITWGALWGAIGAAVGFVVGLVNPALWNFMNPVEFWGLGLAAYGFLSGVGFGGLLSLREGRRTLGDLSLGRVAIWGVLGSAAVPLLFGALGFFEAGTTLWDVASAMLLTAGLGGTFAPGSVAIARRAELAAPDEARLIE